MARAGMGGVVGPTPVGVNGAWSENGQEEAEEEESGRRRRKRRWRKGET